MKSDIGGFVDLIKKNSPVHASQVIFVINPRHLRTQHLDLLLSYALHKFFIGESILYNIRNINDRHSVMLRKMLQIIFSRHRSVIFDDFTNHTGGCQTGQFTEIHRSLCMPCPHQDATLFGDERKDMSGTHKVIRSSQRIGQFPDTVVSLRRRYTCRRDG